MRLSRCIFFIQASSLLEEGEFGIRLIYSQLSSDLWAVRLEDGNDILMSLRRFVEAKRIRAGLLEGLGSLEEERLGEYDFAARRQFGSGVEEGREIGNISWDLST